jgi:hypothetical protein
MEKIGTFTMPCWVLSTVAMILVSSSQLPGQSDSGSSSNAERMSVVTWSAELNGKREIPTVVTDASGKASLSFDFAHRKASISLTTSNLQNVEKIELRIRRSSHDASGPTLITVYDSKNGPFEGRIFQTFPSSRFTEIASTVLNDRATVVVCTKSHPNGEIAGRIRMQKTYR